MLDSFEFMVNA